MISANFGRSVIPSACALVCLGVLGSVGFGRETPRFVNRVAPALAANAEVATAPRAMPVNNAPSAKPEPVIVSAAASAPAEPQTTSHEFEAAAEAGLADSAQKAESETPPAQAATREPEPSVEATLADSTQKPPSEAPPVQTASLEPQPSVEQTDINSAEKLPAEAPPAATAGTPGPVREASLNSVEIFDECYVADSCIDRYLWALYQRTPKEDSIKQQEQHRVTVKRKGKLVTITRTSTSVVDEDFAWKDPKAAERANMTMMDYVIGGMDRSFKLKLFNVLRAAEAAGLSPGITSAFRDDYRQSIAAGLKAANDRSYHGGSFRGGYGHGLAADVVSVTGATRSLRQASSENLWKWIDTHGREFGIGRPYLDRDPPHMAPTDGNEYISRRGTKHQDMASKPEKRKRVAVR
jgi:hypothetical protein